MTVLDELTPYYDEILDLMPNEFDSHRFILKLAHKHQREYVNALYACRDVRDRAPFREVHKQISQSLNDYADKIREQYSPDIFGEDQSNAVWRKRSH